MSDQAAVKITKFGSAMDGREEDRIPAGMPGAGTIMTTLGQTPSLWLHLKIYETGENKLHAHPDEDHFFYILEGRAEFTEGDGSTFEAGPHEGVVIPAGGLYCFRVIGDERLAMLRIGAPARSDVDRGRILKNRVEVGAGSP